MVKNQVSISSCPNTDVAGLYCNVLGAVGCFWNFRLDFTLGIAYRSQRGVERLAILKLVSYSNKL